MRADESHPTGEPCRRRLGYASARAGATRISLGFFAFSLSYRAALVKSAYAPLHEQVGRCSCKASSAAHSARLKSPLEGLQPAVRLRGRDLLVDLAAFVLVEKTGTRRKDAKAPRTPRVSAYRERLCIQKSPCDPAPPSVPDTRYRRRMRPCTLAPLASLPSDRLRYKVSASAAPLR
jgi:hypothetical protein